MSKNKMRKQLNKIYAMCAIGNLSIGGASWVALLCAGLALLIGYKAANAIDAVLNLICIGIGLSLAKEPGRVKVSVHRSLWGEIKKCFTESFRLLADNRSVTKIMLCNALVETFAILLVFFLQARLPQAGLKEVWLGPALFVMGMGGVIGAKVVVLLKKWKYRRVVLVSLGLVMLGVLAERTNVWPLLCLGGFMANFADDFVQIRSDALLNDRIPSKQRATLISVSSFCFSVLMIVLSPLAGWFFGS